MERPWRATQELPGRRSSARCGRAARALLLDGTIVVPMRAFVADDDPEMLSAVAEALTERGFVVEMLTSGVDLIERLAESPAPDLLVTDVAMPWMSGIQVALATR